MLSRQPVITAGEPEGGAWCPVCLEPWRLRIPLLLDGAPAVVLEICPGCGTGHDQSAAYVVPAPGGARSRLLPVLRRPRLPEDQCANGDCRKRPRGRHEASLQGDDGTWTFRFCSARCREAWAAENGIPGT